MTARDFRSRGASSQSELGKKKKKKEQIDERINEALAGLSFIARDDRAAHQTQQIPQEHAGKL